MMKGLRTAMGTLLVALIAVQDQYINRVLFTGQNPKSNNGNALLVGEKR